MYPQILILVSYFIASGFMSVFHMAVDTIFICACECSIQNDVLTEPSVRIYSRGSVNAVFSAKLYTSSKGLSLYNYMYISN